MQAAFEMLKKACLETPVLAFADFNKPFLLETDVSKLGLGVMLSQEQPDGWYHPVTHVSQSLNIHENNYHSTKQKVLALKWAIAEQFQEYLDWKLLWKLTITHLPTLTYQHHWVESLEGLTFSIEYQKGRDNTVAGALSYIAAELDTEVVKSILDGVTLGDPRKGWCSWPGGGWGWWKDI